MLPDEYDALQDKCRTLVWNVKEAWKDAWEAIDQSSETWHDNAPLDAARLAWEIASKQLREVQEILANTVIISEIVQRDIVAIWKRVKLLVGDEEKDIVIWWYQTPIAWRVSYAAPLIQPLLWRAVWDYEEVHLWGKIIDIEILHIEDGI